MDALKKRMIIQFTEYQTLPKWISSQFFLLLQIILAAKWLVQVRPPTR